MPQVIRGLNCSSISIFVSFFSGRYVSIREFMFVTNELTE